MNTYVRLLPVIFACIVTQSFAVDPPPKPAEPDKPASPPAAAITGSQPTPSPTDASSNTATPSNPTRVVLEDKTLTNEEVRQLLAQGYKPVGRGGEVYYCRREQIVGSLIAAMSCKTAEQMKQLTQESKDMLAAKQKPGGCGYGGC